MLVHKIMLASYCLLHMQPKWGLSCTNGHLLLYFTCRATALCRKSKASTATLPIMRYHSEGAIWVMCLVQELFVAHVGDSGALVLRDGKARRLTKDHKPSVPAEAARIQAAGGTVCLLLLGMKRVIGADDSECAGGRKAGQGGQRHA